MSVGFGLSMGTFFAGVDVVKSFMTEFEEGAGSGAVYQELITEFYDLENALMPSTNPIIQSAVLKC